MSHSSRLSSILLKSSSVNILSVIHSSAVFLTLLPVPEDSDFKLERELARCRLLPTLPSDVVLRLFLELLEETELDNRLRFVPAFRGSFSSSSTSSSEDDSFKNSIPEHRKCQLLELKNFLYEFNQRISSTNVSNKII